MKILSAIVKNFGSYKDLSIDFTDKGLTLVSGPTGSGKSTLCDIIPWVLFGRTAKNGNADEVISWNATAPTEGVVYLTLNGKNVSIHRSRGPNDLYFFDYKDNEHGSEIRGKDLNDTQKLINDLLGMTAETYLSGAYFHEFSQAAQFFITTAKNRRVITEQLADLTLAKSLQEKSSAYTKELKKEIDDLSKIITINENDLKFFHKCYASDSTNSTKWTAENTKSIMSLEHKMLNYEQLKDESIATLIVKSEEFEQTKQDKITSIGAEIDYQVSQLRPLAYFEAQELEFKKRESNIDTAKCKECGSIKDNHVKLVLTKDIYNFDREKNKQYQVELEITKLQSRLIQAKHVINPILEQIEKEKNSTNTYIEQLEHVKSQVNPYILALANTTKDIKVLKVEVTKNKELLTELNIELADLELLGDVINDLRSSVIQRTISLLETSTNKYLETYFDAEIRIKLEVADSDKLEVSINKDGNVASYTQLSKGQRQMLNLCFGSSVMKAVSNHNGASFNCLFFDEVLSGMDGELKVKAFSLLESLALETENIFCVEHNDNFKTLFSNTIRVTLVNEESQIEST